MKELFFTNRRIQKLNRIKIRISLLLLVLTSCTPAVPEKNVTLILPPEQLYGRLFYDVQENERIFSDSKTFVDCIPLYDPETIRNNYSKHSNGSDAALLEFIRNNFIIPGESNKYITDSAEVSEHITSLWKTLKRPPDSLRTGTLIPLNKPYIVPGGRFREIYYWDSYFTMLGLKADDEVEIIENMIANFSGLIDSLGFIPNGNRTYYLSRSQPPFYSLMIDLLASIKGERVYTDHILQMEKEYNFWMRGSENPDKTGNSFTRVVRLPGGEILNRYWDELETPRAESYREDRATCAKAVLNNATKNPGQCYRNLRAAAESGWDFSSRWLKEVQDTFQLYTIHTTDIVPVDLNCLIYHLEISLAKTCKLKNRPADAASYIASADKRKQAILKYCWNSNKGFFMDYNFKSGKSTNVYSLAGVYPLFFSLANPEQAKITARKIKDDFLKEGGLVTTLNRTGQQWDASNGWAPLHWMAITALRNYKHNKLAEEIKSRWILTVNTVYYRTYQLFEKYNVEDLSLKEGGGEYPTQDGFGWTNGVYQALVKEKKNVMQYVK